MTEQQKWLSEEAEKLDKLEKERKRHKEYYEKNKNEINKKINLIKKNNKWKYYQSEQSKLNKSIKNKTRYKYPIKNNMCQLCFINKAEHHHHTTKPLEIDKFIFVCKECHKQIHSQEIYN